MQVVMLGVVHPVYWDACLMTRVPLVTAPRRAPCHYPAHNRCFFMYLLHLLDVTVGSLRSAWLNRLCLAFLIYFFEVLKATYHLQLFQDIATDPLLYSSSLYPILHQAVCTSPSLTLVLPIPQKTLVCFLCLCLLLFIICDSLLYCFGLLIYNYIRVYTCIYICGKIIQVLTYI